MRRLILSLFFLCASLQAKDISITTWNLHWFPSGNSKGIASPTEESERIHSAAEVLKKLDSDIVVLQEVRDYAACEALAKKIGDKYQVLVCSAFKSGFGGVPGLQQVAILSKYPAQSCWSEDWKNFGRVDPPRGFVFAHIKIDNRDIAVYGVHFKSNLVMRGDRFKEGQLNLLKRELAAEQVIAHSSQIGRVLGVNFDATIVAGDFNTNRDQIEFASERTLQLFYDNGFRSSFENISVNERVTHPSKGKYPDATFDYIFIKEQVKKLYKPTIAKSDVSDHLPVSVIVRSLEK